MTTSQDRTLLPIPQPKPKPIIGNALDVSNTTPIADLVALAAELGPIFQIDVMGKAFNVVSSFELVDELCDEKRFDKSVRGPLHKVREIAGDGLFTAYTTEPNWSKAHNILLPNFGDRAIKGYYPSMLDVAEQLMLKWGRLNGDEEIDVAHDMTSLTLDTIALCGFGYRLNSFYRERHHPFIAAMSEALGIAMTTKGVPFEEFFSKAKQKRLEADAATMNAVVDKIVADRRAELAASDEPTTKTDLLSYMLSVADRKTGERLDDTNIRYQIITFLIAGHETTSGLLASTIYYLLNDPGVLARAYDEVDGVLGTDLSVMPSVREINGLAYITQILNETLRLRPPAPAFAVLPYQDEVLAGKYFIKKRSQNMILLPALHRDRAVWGERADVWDPEHFSPENEAKLPLNAFKPFGNGQRACIGRQFAMQEAALVIGMMLQRFKLIDHERYQAKYKEALTVKLIDLKMKVRPRGHAHVHAAPPSSARARNGSAAAVPVAARVKHNMPLLILFGSNLGTSEDIARQMAEAATAQGFNVRLSPLDDAVGKLPTEGGLFVVCASYNGAPPDNATEFYRWLHEDLRPGALAGVRYSVFGCGNRNWASTYQSVPRQIDEKLAEFGAQRMYVRGEGDAREDIDEDFRLWRAALWQKISKDLDLEFDAGAAADRSPYEIEFVAGPAPEGAAAEYRAAPMRVVANRELQTTSLRSTRHIEFALPAGTTYRPGDHLGIVPANRSSLVQRVLDRFGFAPGTYVRLAMNGSRVSLLPLGTPIALDALLGGYVELQQVATRKQISTLAEHTQCPRTKPELVRLASDAGGDASPYMTEVRAKRLSVLDLLEAHPACELPFHLYLDMLPLIAPRYYSISSSPRVSPETCSITVGVVRGDALSGSGFYEGVCSTLLEDRHAGALVAAYVKDAKTGFRLPDDTTRPIVMIGPGTGLAPFRGFLAERRVLRSEGKTLGPALLFFGCRHPEADFIYREELEGFVADGLVEMHVAFSRHGEQKVYVQHLLAERGDEVWALLEAGANVYVCGDASRMEPDVRETFSALYRRKTGADEASAAAWLARLAEEGRYHLDVWATV